MWTLFLETRSERNVVTWWLLSQNLWEIPVPPHADDTKRKAGNASEECGAGRSETHLATGDHNDRSGQGRGRIDIGTQNHWDLRKKNVANHAATHASDCPEQDSNEWTHLIVELFFVSGDSEERQAGSIDAYQCTGRKLQDKAVKEKNGCTAKKCSHCLAQIAERLRWRGPDEEISHNTTAEGGGKG